jgi:hypothetical protein
MGYNIYIAAQDVNRFFRPGAGRESGKWTRTVLSRFRKAAPSAGAGLNVTPTVFPLEKRPIFILRCGCGENRTNILEKLFKILKKQIFEPFQSCHNSLAYYL